MPEQSLPLSVFYDLMLADRAVSRMMRLALADSDITPLEYGIYSALHAEPGVTATRLAADMHTPLTTMADWLAKPVRRGHVDRTRSAADGRAWALRLSARGEAAFERGRRDFADAYVKYLALPSVDIEAQQAALASIRSGALAIADELESLREAGRSG